MLGVGVVNVSVSNGGGNRYLWGGSDKHHHFHVFGIHGVTLAVNGVVVVVVMAVVVEVLGQWGPCGSSMGGGSQSLWGGSRCHHCVGGSHCCCWWWQGW